jgi:hypothetical protein
MRRSVRAIFVEEIGIGGIFIQSDLSPKDCYILDDGYANIYAWIGDECKYPAMALLTRVSRKLIAAMRENTSVTSESVSSTEENSNSSPFSAPTDISIRVTYVNDGCEPADFIQHFREWKVSADRKLNNYSAIVNFSPESVAVDESNDLLLDDNGNLLCETLVQKVKYSDSHEYKRDNSPAHAVQESRKDDFKNVHLKRSSTSSPSPKNSPIHTPPAYKLRATSKESHSPQVTPKKTPEYTSFMSKLRHVSSPSSDVGDAGYLELGGRHSNSESLLGRSMNRSTTWNSSQTSSIDSSNQSNSTKESSCLVCCTIT